MYLAKLQCGMIFTTLLILVSVPATARDLDQLDWTETKDKWGQLIFCQRIYKMPEVNPRLYSFDFEQCDKAGQLVTDIVAKYSKQEQVQLRNQAEQHAIKLSYNTSEPYHSVVACREYCRELAEKQDTRND